MRALSCLAMIVGVVTQGTASAQAPAAKVDLFGVYAAPTFVAVPDVVEPDVFPYTAAGKRAFDAYDPLVEDPRQADDCAAEAMPGILWSGDPMQLTEKDGMIEMRFERADTVRSIYMDGDPPPADLPHSLLGYSVGRWVGNELRIETTHIMDGVIRTNRGYPISRNGRVTERYWRNPGRNDLQVEVWVDDPVNYTETVKLGREWIWAPHDEIRSWNCVNFGPRDGELDIDELARMLEEL